MFLTWRRSVWAALLGLVAGCSHHSSVCSDGLVERVLPPPDAPADAAPEPAGPTTQTDTAAVHDSADRERAAGKTPPTPNSPSQQVAVDHVPCRPLTLSDAVALAFRLQPRLRASLESIEQARGREDIAFAAFLPTLTTGYSVGGFDLNVGGHGISIPNTPAFSFIPFTGAVPVGLTIDSGYELAELKLQWLVCDFGRRLGRYNQAGLAADIAQLQAERAYQTVANGVAAAYYQLLRARGRPDRTATDGR
jgi:outer membrane protein TolC